MEMTAAHQRIITDLGRLEDWMEKYEYLIRLGDRLGPMDPALRSEENAVSGCQSRLWIAAEAIDGKMRLRGDCDARITRGVLALVLSIADGHSPEDVASLDLHCLEELGLTSSLSPSRANGLEAVMHRLRELGASFANP